jgi:CRP-like cAMP-binding protein
LQPVELKPRQILHHWGTPMEQVYFIERGLVSVTTRISRDSAVEVWLIGCEGMTGVPVVLGGDFAPPHRRIVQVGGSALRLASSDLHRAMDESAALREMLLRYAQVILLQASQVGACNAHHTLEERLCRWLLMARDGLGGDELPLTHRVLSRLLGVRRASVTECLGALERKGALENTRGLVHIVDAAILNESCCACYRLIRCEYERLLVPPNAAATGTGLAAEAGRHAMPPVPGHAAPRGDGARFTPAGTPRMRS